MAQQILCNTCWIDFLFQFDLDRFEVIELEKLIFIYSDRFGFVTLDRFAFVLTVWKNLSLLCFGNCLLVSCVYFKGFPRLGFLDFDSFYLEIKKTPRALRKQKESSTSSVANQHIEDKVLRDYSMPYIDGATTSIWKPISQTAHFKIKSANI